MPRNDNIKLPAATATHASGCQQQQQAPAPPAPLQSIASGQQVPNGSSSSSNNNSNNNSNSCRGSSTSTSRPDQWPTTNGTATAAQQMTSSSSASASPGAPATTGRLQPSAKSRCYLCETPKHEYSLIRSFSEIVCRGCLNYEGPERVEQLILDARRDKGPHEGTATLVDLTANSPPSAAAHQQVQQPPAAPPPTCEAPHQTGGQVSRGAHGPPPPNSGRAGRGRMAQAGRRPLLQASAATMAAAGSCLAATLQQPAQASLNSSAMSNNPPTTWPVPAGAVAGNFSNGPIGDFMTEETQLSAALGKRRPQCSASSRPHAQDDQNKRQSPQPNSKQLSGWKGSPPGQQEPAPKQHGRPGGQVQYQSPCTVRSLSSGGAAPLAGQQVPALYSASSFTTSTSIASATATTSGPASFATSAPQQQPQQQQYQTVGSPVLASVATGSTSGTGSVKIPLSNCCAASGIDRRPGSSNSSSPPSPTQRQQPAATAAAAAAHLATYPPAHLRLPIPLRALDPYGRDSAAAAAAAYDYGLFLSHHQQQQQQHYSAHPQAQQPPAPVPPRSSSGGHLQPGEPGAGSGLELFVPTGGGPAQARQSRRSQSGAAQKPLAMAVGPPAAGPIYSPGAGAYPPLLHHPAFIPYQQAGYHPGYCLPNPTHYSYHHHHMLAAGAAAGQPGPAAYSNLLAAAAAAAGGDAIHLKGSPVPAVAASIGGAEPAAYLLASSAASEESAAFDNYLERRLLSADLDFRRQLQQRHQSAAAAAAAMSAAGANFAQAAAGPPEQLRPDSVSPEHLPMTAPNSAGSGSSLPNTEATLRVLLNSDQSQPAGRSTNGGPGKPELEAAGSRKSAPLDPSGDKYTIPPNGSILTHNHNPSKPFRLGPAPLKRPYQLEDVSPPRSGYKSATSGPRSPVGPKEPANKRQATNLGQQQQPILIHEDELDSTANLQHHYQHHPDTGTHLPPIGNRQQQQHGSTKNSSMDQTGAGPQSPQSQQQQQPQNCNYSLRSQAQLPPTPNSTGLSPGPNSTSSSSTSSSSSSAGGGRNSGAQNNNAPGSGRAVKQSSGPAANQPAPRTATDEAHGQQAAAGAPPGVQPAPHKNSFDQLKCLICNERLEDRHFVQCPTVQLHKFCFACSKVSIQDQRKQNKSLNPSEDKIFCPSGKKCLLASERSPWTFMNNEIETIFRESSRAPDGGPSGPNKARAPSKDFYNDCLGGLNDLSDSLEVSGGSNESSRSNTDTGANNNNKSNDIRLASGGKHATGANGSSMGKSGGANHTINGNTTNKI